MDWAQLILLVLAFAGGMVTMIVLSAVMVSRDALSPEEERLSDDATGYLQCLYHAGRFRCVLRGDHTPDAHLVDLWPPDIAAKAEAAERRLEELRD